MRTAYRVRVYPDAEQAAMLRRTFGCIRVVWNKTLSERQARYAVHGKPTTYKQTDAALTAWKKTEDLTFLQEVAAVPLQQTLRHQQFAFDSFFKKRSRYPRFKTRNSRQSAHYSRAGFRIKYDGLWIAKASSPLKVAWSWPEIDMTTLNPTMVVISSESDGRWFVSFAVEREDPTPLMPNDRTIGVDVGLKHFAVLSNGDKIANPTYFAKRERSLARHQRRLARCQNGSKNRVKAKRKVARVHSKIRDARQDFLHKTSTKLIHEYDRIGIEDFPIAGLIRNRRLGKSIKDVGWGQFRVMLQYKAQRTGRQVIAVDRWYPSSKTCSSCGYLLSELSLKTRHWTCPKCSTRHDRDINAAKNIDTAAGLVVAASGGMMRPVQATAGHVPMKEETPQVTAGNLSSLRRVDQANLAESTSHLS